METIWYFWIWVGVMGLAIGSFLNVVIYRLPRKIMFKRSRSICPHCEKQLSWHHNIPVISFLALRGKCSFCGKRISIRYPLVELVNAGLFLFFFHLHGLTIEFGIYAVLSSALLAVILIDYDFYIIPDSITLPGIVIGLAVSSLPGGLTIGESALGLMVGGGALYLIAILGDWLFKKESMGGGDIKLMAMLGTFIGWQKILFVFMTSAVIGLIVSLAVMSVSSKLRQSRMIPFGPFLATAALIAIVWGDRIINLYLVNVVGMTIP